MSDSESEDNSFIDIHINNRITIKEGFGALRVSASSVSEEFFTSMNKLGIRHNSDSQIKLHYSKKNAVYDKLFKMSLFVIQSEEVSVYKDELKAIRDE